MPRDLLTAWQLREQRCMVHVTPINDLQEHELDPACWCNPRVEEHQRLLVIHNSADGRELVEKHGVN